MRDEGSRVYLRSPIHLHYVDINNSAQKCRPSRASLCTTRPRDASVPACLRPNLEITGREKKKKKKQNCLREKRRSLSHFFSIFFYVEYVFEHSTFGERRFIRNLKIETKTIDALIRLYLRRIMHENIESIFCNYAIGSRNFSRNYLTRVF